MWRAITYVSSGITLAAFIFAVAAWIYRAKILEREHLIRQAPAANRAALIERTLEFFSIDTSELNRQQKYDLALQQIHQRAARFRVTAIVVIIIACLAAGVSVFALWRAPSARSNNPLPTPTPVKEPVVKFIPLDDKESLIKSFTVKGSGDRVTLRFFSKNLDLAFDFTAPLDITSNLLLRQILDHFSLQEHIQTDVRVFPTGISGGFWVENWKLVLKGQEVSGVFEGSGDKSLRDLAAANGDKVGLRLTWTLATAISSSGGHATGEEAKSPPDVDL
jgi:hypothetical protein